MVDKDHVLREFKKYFSYHGDVHMDDQAHITVTGTVKARAPLPGPHLPVAFLKVSGNFDLGVQENLVNLLGCPRSIGGDFVVRAPNLTSLEGAPHEVRGVCRIKSASLKSLVGLPVEGSNRYTLTWTPHLGLLSVTILPKTSHITWAFPTQYGGASSQNIHVVRIMEEKYLGTGKAGALKAAGELIKAGYKENARW